MATSEEVRAALTSVGADETMPEDAIRDLAKQALMRAHPDHGGTSDAFRAALRARDIIEASAEARQICPTCDGKGKVMLPGRNWQTFPALCGTCRGTGRKP